MGGALLQGGLRLGLLMIGVYYALFTCFFLACNTYVLTKCTMIRGY